MKKYIAQDIVKNLQEIKFPNITYNSRHEIMSNVIIEIAPHEYLCIGKCGHIVGYRYMFRKNGKHTYTKQIRIKFGNENWLNNIGIYDPTANNILIVAMLLMFNWSRKYKSIPYLDIPEGMTNTAVLKLTNLLALYLRFNITSKDTNKTYRTYDSALWNELTQSQYFDVKEHAPIVAVFAKLTKHTDTGTNALLLERFDIKPQKPLHSTSYYRNNAGQRKLKL